MMSGAGGWLTDLSDEVSKSRSVRRLHSSQHCHLVREVHHEIAVLNDHGLTIHLGGPLDHDKKEKEKKREKKRGKGLPSTSSGENQSTERRFEGGFPLVLNSSPSLCPRGFECDVIDKKKAEKRREVPEEG